MNIGVNTRLLLKNKLEGIGWYAFQIISRIIKNHPEHTFYLYFDRKYDQEFIFANNAKPIIVNPQARHPLLYGVWFDLQLPLLFRKHKIDIYYSPEGICPLNTKIPCIITIHDLAYLHYPNQLTKTDLLFYKFLQPKFARKAKIINTVSEFSKKDIQNQYGISTQKITVTYNAPHEAYKPISEEEQSHIKEKFTNGRAYFLFVGSLHPRKNIINLLKAFVQFKRRSNSGMKLVIVGRMAWLSENIEEAKRRMPYKDEVVWLGYKDVNELSKITAAAYAMVYPSFFEGFGIPIVEAMACHVPSIVSNTSSMPEVAGNTCLVCDPNDPKDIAAKMHELYKNEALRSLLSSRCVEEIKRFSWDNSAIKVWNNIEKLIKP